MSENIILKIKRISDEFSNLPLPQYATRGSAGLDLCAALKEPYVIKKGAIALIPTNLSVEIPHGYELQVRPRSGLAIKHGIGVLNSPGTIDSDYRGEIKVILINFGGADFTINSGDRIAQMVLSKVYTAELMEADSLSESKRGQGGFGHTGLESR
ncbi:MAG TPA: dUTP diphosphatase [Ignavibacteriales bacterium]|nr:dUTP diphosphatase [Ignavibacteriales bacterium]